MRVLPMSPLRLVATNPLTSVYMINALLLYVITKVARLYVYPRLERLEDACFSHLSIAQRRVN
jgi:hypothetical protein